MEKQRHLLKGNGWIGFSETKEMNPNKPHLAIMERNGILTISHRTTIGNETFTLNCRKSELKQLLEELEK